MIEDQIPHTELQNRENSSLFYYDSDLLSVQDRNSIWTKFNSVDYHDHLQLLDNGVLIIAQNAFGGRAIVSKFTCGLHFCYCLSKSLSKNDSLNSPFKASVAADDHYSGWNYDYNLKVIYSGEQELIVVKDYDFRTELVFDYKAFILNYFDFAKKIINVFENWYPEMPTHPKMQELKNYNIKLALLIKDLKGPVSD